MNRRFNTIVFDFMVGINAAIERFLVQTPLALIFTENESRLTEHRSLSYRSALHLLLMSATNNTAPNYESSTMVDGQQAAWNMLFHNREEAAYRGMNANTTEHSPPSGNSLVTMIARYRATNFTSTVGVMGGEWRNIEPTKLMDVLIYAFVEHELIPPIEESYASSLGNFFSILMSDPMQQVFARHVNILYRRGWRKQNLAQKACYVFVEHYVGLVLMIVQQALLQNNCTLSTTPSFASDVSRFTPMTKLQDVLRTLL